MNFYTLLGKEIKKEVLQKRFWLKKYLLTELRADRPVQHARRTAGKARTRLSYSSTVYIIYCIIYKYVVYNIVYIVYIVVLQYIVVQ